LDFWLPGGFVIVLTLEMSSLAQVWLFWRC